MGLCPWKRGTFQFVTCCFLVLSSAHGIYRHNISLVLSSILFNDELIQKWFVSWCDVRHSLKNLTSFQLALQVYPNPQNQLCWTPHTSPPQSSGNKQKVSIFSTYYDCEYRRNVITRTLAAHTDLGPDVDVHHAAWPLAEHTDARWRRVVLTMTL